MGYQLSINILKDFSLALHFTHCMMVLLDLTEDLEG